MAATQVALMVEQLVNLLGSVILELLVVWLIETCVSIMLASSVHVL